LLLGAASPGFAAARLALRRCLLALVIAFPNETGLANEPGRFP
jgi:hypothetical protein